MIFHLRNILLFSSSAISAVVAGARAGGGAGYNVDNTAPRAHELNEHYTFEQYLTHFNKSYNADDEYNRRSQIFARNLKTILSHNEDKMNENGDVLQGFVMGVNMFTDVDVSELPMGYNKAMHPVYRDQLKGAAAGGVWKTERMLGGVDTESYSQPPDFEIDEIASLPPSIDYVELGKMNPTIPTQGGCGSCWSFATTGVIESHLAIVTGEEVTSLSEQNLLQCTPNPDHCGGTGDCDGSTAELALNYIADQTAQGTGGMYNLADMPYNTNKGVWSECNDLTEGKSPSVGITGWTQLEPNNYKATMNALAKVGPLAIAVAASGWMMYEKGVFEDSDTSTVNHAVVLAGYGVDETTGEKYYKVRNSWGERFGEEGYIRIKRTDDDDNVCLTDERPLVGVACELDDNGNTIDIQPAQICGENGILFDVAYPAGVHKIVNEATA